MNARPLASACQAGRRSAAAFGPCVAAPTRRMDRLAVAAAFRGTGDQVRQARRFTARILNGWPNADDVVFCVSELTANAVVHSASGKPGGIFWLHVTAVPGEYVRVEVCDQGGPWARREQEPERPHGLDIVRLLATEFGVDGDARSGRIAWARLDLPSIGGAMSGPAPDSDLAGAGAAGPPKRYGAGRADGDLRWPG